MWEEEAPKPQRPHMFGYVLKTGQEYDPWRVPTEYPFPCMKPVGQIILGIDSLAGAEAPALSQSCANGVVKVTAAKGDAKANLEYILGMTSDIYAIRGGVSGVTAPVTLRLYRHRDTSHLAYMNADGTYRRAGTELDRAFNFPMDPPSSGREGSFFWIHQRLPSEKTFPHGFEYVLMGIVTTPGEVTLETVENQTKLGTPPQTAAIAAAAGAAATASITPGADGKLEAFVCVVTTLDGPDVMGLAQQRLLQAKAGGFDGVVRENTVWWDAFYARRENGRVFRGVSGTNCTEDVRSVYASYTESHGGGTKVDMRRYEHAASYALAERDIQPWNSMSCYNEIFTTSRFVRNQADSEDMWKHIVQHWMEAGKQNARDVYGLPGMCVVHGYLPPIKADIYVHTTITLELCLGTMAQIIRPAWDEWDYGGDMEMLRKECYPLMKEMAIFYAAYAKKGADGFYHVIPSMEEERWGFYGEFSHNKDVASSLCLFKWALTRAAEAAELLGVDADLRQNWRQVASQIAPYPTWQTPDGPEFAGIPGVEPLHLAADHFGEAAEYPCVLADEVNLDSPEEIKNKMRRTLKALSTAGTTGATALLLGAAPAAATGRGNRGRPDDPETLLNSRSGRIHLFPASQPDSELAFRKFQARGAFLVSACKNASGVTYVEIEARRALPCQVMNPWPGKAVIVHELGKSEKLPATLDKSNGECVVFAAQPGHKYVIEQSA